ncbi:MAG: response regulator [Bacteroidia bacterium]|nr:response regulator [Bacteroidia bacterium]HQV00831.1 response regulator [Bacteroidia bacterium]
MEDLSIIKVLYVDDEAHNLNAFKASFRRVFTVFIALSADEAKQIMSENEIHVLITDQRMPGTPGTELLAYAVKDKPDQIRILLTGFSDMDALQDAVNRGHIYRYLQKPWDDEILRQTIIEAYQIYALKLEREALTQKLQQNNEQLEFYLRHKLLS